MFKNTTKPVTRITVVWMYYKTDGDSGYYGIKLFRTELQARAYLKREQDAYGNVTTISIED